MVGGNIGAGSSSSGGGGGSGSGGVTTNGAVGNAAAVYWNSLAACRTLAATVLATTLRYIKYPSSLKILE
jgi:hypothetical protein